MDPAASLALIAAALNLAAAVVFLGVARAPGWRVARLFALIALTAGLYNLLSLALCLPDQPERVYLAAGRFAYLVGTLHCAGWLLYAFGDAEGSWRSQPRSIRWTLGLALGTGALFAFTGLHLQTEVAVVDVGWAGVTYHYPLTTTAGDAYGLLLPLLLAVVFVRLLQRHRGGERHFRWHLIGFSLFFLCVLDEVLVANRVLQFLSLADLGFLFVVIPLSFQVVHRVTTDACRLQELSSDLEGKVLHRTEERDQARAALVESERLAALGRLAAGVGHEINNPLTYLQLALTEVRTHLQSSHAPADVQQALTDALDGARRVQKVVEGLRGYSRGAGQPVPLDPHEVARTALKVAGPQLRHLSAVDLDLGPTPPIRGHESQLVQALINLLVNAAQAVGGTDRESRIVLRTVSPSSADVLFVVEDNGPGIPPEHLRRLSEPYFTTRTANGGLGLGLFITRGIVSTHGGRLEFESSLGRGTVARIVLPALKEVPGTDPTASQASTQAIRRGTTPEGLPTTTASPETSPVPTTPDRARHLLLVDDEPVLLKVMSRYFSRTWTVSTALGGEEALRLIRQNRYQAILCDLMMPGMSGAQFAEALAAYSPELRKRTFFLTGGAVTPWAQDFLRRPDVRFFEKPVDLPKVSSALEALVTTIPSGRT